MPLKIKTLIGIYIFSILLFSGVSRADVSFNPFQSLQYGQPSMDASLVESTGTVFEFNGDLYFESSAQETLLVHSSNFQFFENIKLPVEVNASSVIMSHGTGFSESLKTIRFVTDSLRKKSLL